MNTDDPAEGASPIDSADDAAALRRQLEAAQRSVAELSAEVTTLRARLDPPTEISASHDAPLMTTPVPGAAAEATPSASRKPRTVDQRSSGAAKIALYRSLFAGRDDVFARRWENPAEGTQGWAPARTGSANTPSDQRASLPFTAEILSPHRVDVGEKGRAEARDYADLNRADADALQPNSA